MLPVVLPAFWRETSRGASRLRAQAGFPKPACEAGPEILPNLKGPPGARKACSSPSAALLPASTTPTRASTLTIRFHRGDLPGLERYRGIAAIDTETLGLNPHRDRLCVVQLSPGDGSADVVQIPAGGSDAPNLKQLLADPAVTKIFHYARFDVAVLYHAFGVMTGSIYCTKIASKLVRTYTDRHGLKDLARELLGVELSKQQQSSDWGAADLTEAQLAYAASDVLHLHELKAKLDAMLAREGRAALAKACFDFVPARALLDLEGWAETDIFAHS